MNQREEIEILDAVATLEQEIFESTGETEYLNITLITNGLYARVAFVGIDLWCSEDDDRKFDETKDAYEPMEPYLRRRLEEELAKLAMISKASLPAESVSMYYMQRNVSGRDDGIICFVMVGRGGCVTDLNMAHVFTENEAKQFIADAEIGKYTALSKRRIDKVAHRTVELQCVDEEVMRRLNAGLS